MLRELFGTKPPLATKKNMPAQLELIQDFQHLTNSLLLEDHKKTINEYFKLLRSTYGTTFPRPDNHHITLAAAMAEWQIGR
ncbi:hypothetical protein B9Z19DRAFT_357835 [Tuber borchii]|uniref:Uncharacterized protein n=1 Tax=Tuber borchii TaxID=42251 RepID=A0A2T6ZIH9_TUBBO|nr:hypothetical protein B9Z19DRAFT_357835 [Tuber borchii]